MSNMILFRALRPHWSYAPLSGSGAAANGGRWNCKGRQAIYLAGDPQTALNEYWQGLEARPAMIVQYTVTNAEIAALDDPALRAEAQIPGDIMDLAWRNISRQDRIPESWTIVERLIGMGYHGLAYPSRINAGTCICLWAWNDDSGCTVTAHDLHGDLPRNQASWTD